MICVKIDFRRDLGIGSLRVMHINGNLIEPRSISPEPNTAHLKRKKISETFSTRNVHCSRRLGPQHTMKWLIQKMLVCHSLSSRTNKSISFVFMQIFLQKRCPLVIQYGKLNSQTRVMRSNSHLIIDLL